jgi:hypothetical protein
MGIAFALRLREVPLEAVLLQGCAELDAEDMRVRRPAISVLGEGGVDVDAVGRENGGYRLDVTEDDVAHPAHPLGEDLEIAQGGTFVRSWSIRIAADCRLQR